jgi:hypothetical protein
MLDDKHVCRVIFYSRRDRLKGNNLGRNVVGRRQ